MNGATTRYPAARATAAPAIVAVKSSSGSTVNPYPRSRSTSCARERLVVFVTSRNGTPEARSRASASGAPGIARPPA